MNIYPHIYRPCDNNALFLDRRFSMSYVQDCGSYAYSENQLRKQLTKPNRFTLYSQIRNNTFTLQEFYMQIAEDNGQKVSRHVTWADLSKLNPYMKLSDYRCELVINDSVQTLCPFSSLEEKCPKWYYENTSAFFGNREQKKEAQLEDLILSTAALRILLYAQYGPLSEDAITRDDSRGPGSGYFTCTSIFQVVSPMFDGETYSYENPQFSKITL